MNNLLAKIHAENMDPKRVIDYFGTLSPEYNKAIMSLDYRNLGKWSPRDTPEENIKTTMGLNFILPRKFLLISNNKGNVSLRQNSQKYKCNNFYDLSLRFPNTKNLNDYIIYFSLVPEGIKRPIAGITTTGNKIFYNNKRQIKKGETHTIYPIYLFECLEKGYFDINDIKEDICIIIKYMKLTSTASNIEEGDLELWCNAISCDNKHYNNYNEYSLLDSVYTVDIQDNKIKLEKEKLPSICSCIYITLQDNQKIDSLSLKLGTYKIEYMSSKVYSNNEENLHVFWLFPDSDTDLIKNQKVHGFNMTQISSLEIDINFQDISTNKATIGLLGFNIISYTNIVNILI
jgi:hypothetical protein